MLTRPIVTVSNKVIMSFNTPECKYFRTRRGCKYGSSCRFRHVAFPIPCKFLKNLKYCKNGHNCRFSHDPVLMLSESEIPCRNFEKYNFCFINSWCWFNHSRDQPERKEELECANETGKHVTSVFTKCSHGTQKCRCSVTVLRRRRPVVKLLPRYSTM